MSSFSIETTELRLKLEKGPSSDTNYATIKEGAVDKVSEMATVGSKLVIKKELVDNQTEVKVEYVEHDHREYNKCLILKDQQMERDREKLYSGLVIKGETTISPEGIQLPGAGSGLLRSDIGSVACGRAQTARGAKELLRAALEAGSAGDARPERRGLECTSGSDLTVHIERLSDNLHKCTICGSNFLNTSLLKKHIQTHSGVNGKKLTRITNLKPYIRKYTSDKPYCCDICDKRFTQRGGLTIHMRTHTGDKPYCCNICNMKFAYNKSFRLHMQTHTGDKLHRCNICNMTFTRSCDIRVHKRTHTVDKPDIPT